MCFQLPALLCLSATLILLPGCGGGGSGDKTNPIPPTASPTQSPTVGRLELDGIDSILAEFDNAEYVLIIGDTEGELYAHIEGDTARSEKKLIASASKWLSSAAILALVEQGSMDLSDRPQQYIDWWTEDPTDQRSQITLQHLLAFTSGFTLDDDELGCTRDRETSLDRCSREIYEQGVEYAPGEAFYYSPAHLQIAGLMAEIAAGQPFAEIFRLNVASPLRMDNTEVQQDTANPLLAGGYVSTANDYAHFLAAVLEGVYLPGMREAWEADHTSSPVILANTPVSGYQLADVASIVGGEWHYALGHWRECEEAEWTTSCDDVAIVSSPGAFGWYPWVDFEYGYYGLIATRVIAAGRGSLPSILFGRSLQDHVANQVRALQSAAK